MKYQENISNRLIVAADFDPRKCGGRNGARREFMRLARNLEGTGVVIKGNSIFRSCGIELVEELNKLGLNAFVDWKLNDIPKTMEMDAAMIADVDPYMLTVMASAGSEGCARVSNVLGKNRVFAVTVLTSLDEEECQSVFTTSVRASVLRLARNVNNTVGGLVLAPSENQIITSRSQFDFKLCNPNIRPAWVEVKDDDQNPNRARSVPEAFQGGADRIVVGRPITQSDDPAGAVSKILAEIDQALKEES